MNVIRIGMADLSIAKAPDILTTLGLGSCIGLTLYDPIKKIGGMVHYMLPDSTVISNNSNIAKFADTGIQELLDRVLREGANKNALQAKIAGGAQMFAVNRASLVGNIGEKNAIAAKQILNNLRIPLIAEDTGLDFGRTVELHCQTGEFYIKAIKQPIKII